MAITEITLREPRSLSTVPSQNCCMQWLWRCWERICECFILLQSLFQGRHETPQLRNIIPITPVLGAPPILSKAAKLITAFSLHLNTLPLKSRSTQFIGKALFFSLSPSDQYALLSRLKSTLPEMPLTSYLQELPSELQDCFIKGLEAGSQSLLLETYETPTQRFLQSCLFDLLVTGVATKAPAGFESCILIDQLQILHFLYRILYYSDLRFENRDLYIHQLLLKLPQKIQRDIASKAKTPSDKDLCISLNKHYIHPAASSDPEIVRQTFFNLYEQVDCPAALENFSRLPREMQTSILANLEAMISIDEEWMRSYQFEAFAKWTREEQCALLNNLLERQKVDEDLIEAYIDSAHPSIREKVQLLWKCSTSSPFHLIVKTALKILPN